MPTSFSERFGYKKAREIIQRDEMDMALRNGLWSIFVAEVLDTLRYDYTVASHHHQNTLFRRLWIDHFKVPLDVMPTRVPELNRKLREYYFGADWNEVYDFIEFVVNNYRDSATKERLTGIFNYRLEAEMSAYRFVDGNLAAITDDQEIIAIESAADVGSTAVKIHLQSALRKLSDRGAPDYRNSVKESISAVESLAAEVTRDRKATLGQLTKNLKAEHNIHPALADAFSMLYGYTSDEGGIRHKLLEADVVDFHDAKFMLVTCSAFVNFVVGKQSQENKSD